VHKIEIGKGGGGRVGERERGPQKCDREGLDKYTRGVGGWRRHRCVIEIRRGKKLNGFVCVHK